MTKTGSLLIFLTLFLTSCGGGPADLSGVKPGNKDALVLITAELVGHKCLKKRLEIGRAAGDGTYKKAAVVPIGTSWASTGAQATLAPGQYHIVGMTCHERFNNAFIPGRREASMIPFNPTWYDSLGQFTVTTGEVVSLGNMRVIMQDDGRFSVSVTPFTEEQKQKISRNSSSVGSRMISRPLAVAPQPVQGRCVSGTVVLACDRLKILHEQLTTAIGASR